MPCFSLCSKHRILDCLRALLILELSHKNCHFRLCWLASSLSNTNRLNYVALLTKIRHSHVKIFAILLWLSPDNTFCCFQLTNLDSLEKLVDLSDIVHSTLAMISKVFHFCVLFMLSTKYLSQSHPFFSLS